MNMALVETPEDLFAVDCGLAFPDDHMHGVDVIVPDLGYLENNRDKYRGLILTHGHQDHLGGAPWLLDRVGGPIWGSPFTLALLRKQLEDYGHELNGELKTIQDGEPFSVGGCTATPIFMTHSILDAMSIHLKTPGGTMVFSGDFKLDQSPLDGKLSNLGLLSRLGQEGLDLLLMDSTNVTRDGYSQSEKALLPTFESLLQNQQRRLFFTLFSTNMLRLKGIAELCKKHNKRMALIGRSLINTYQVARELGYINIKDDVLVSPDRIRGYAAKQMVIITTGTQGEPMGALSRLAHNEVKQVQVEPGDKIIFSARVIPGNERAIYKLFDQFYRLGAEVLTGPKALVHVSGHGYREELKMYLQMCRPKNFVPLHGNFRNLKLHRDLALEQGVSESNTLLMENGESLRLEDGELFHSGTFSAERLYMDGEVTGSLDGMVLRDRRHMAEDGMVVPVILMNRANGKLETVAEMLCRGVSPPAETEALCQEATAMLSRVLERFEVDEARDAELVEATAIKELRTFFRKRVRKRPLILPRVLEL